jgi:hypothetical protein
MIADGKAPAGVVAEIKRRGVRLAEAEQEVQVLKVEESSEGELRWLRRRFRERLVRFDELPLSDVPNGAPGTPQAGPRKDRVSTRRRNGQRGYDFRWVEGNTKLYIPTT